MPTYDYVCDACGHAFEHFQSMSDKVLRTCPECGKKKLVRQLGTGGGIIFKGSGFYQTDYKKSSPPASKSEPSGEAASGGCGKDACKATPGTCAADAAKAAAAPEKPTSSAKKKRGS